MPDYPTIDPFKPAQPHIPGVSPPSEKTKEHPQSEDDLNAPAIMGPPRSAPEELPDRLKFVWVGLTLAGALLTIFVLFEHGRNAAPAKAANDVAAIETPEKPGPVAEPADAPAIDTKLPVGPGVIATTAELVKPWSARKFYFRDPLTLKEVPALVVRLPGGALWGFSLREPYGTCEMEYVTDLRKLQRDYDFAAGHPMVGDPCNKSLFDLTRYGNAPSGLVRGDIVKGSAFRPPIAIEVRTQGDQVVAIRTEQ
jgi:hypothetical protein